MVTINRWRIFGFLFVAISFVGIGRAPAQDSTQSIDACFPPTTAIYLAVDRPTPLIEKIEKHPLVVGIAELSQFKKLVRSPQFALALLGKGLIETQIGEPLIDAIKTNLSEGLAIGVDLETGGVAIVFRSSDEAKLKRLAGTILKVIAGSAEGSGKKSPFEKGEYRDVVTAKFNDFIIGRFRNTFVIANKPQLAKQIADNLIDGTTNSLATQKWYRDARQQPATSDLSLLFDLEAIKSKGLAKQIFQGRSDNPGAELVLGGLYDALQHASHAAVELNLGDALDISISVPFHADWANKARRFFYGESLTGTAPEPLLPANVVANLVAYRDIADWWLSKEELFTEGVIAQLAQTDSQLSNIFSGMDFGEDVLGSLEPGVQIVVTEKSFDQGYLPDVRLPAFALIGKLKEPEQIRRKLKIAFQSVIGFANIGLGMNGQPQLDLETETIGDAKISATQYVVDDETDAGLLLFNFSPTVAFQGHYLIVSSDRDLAVELADLAGKALSNASIDETVGTDNAPINTRLNLDSVTLSRILKTNLEALIANNMLEKGHGRMKAEEEMALLLSAVELVKNGQLDFAVQPQQMKIDLKLEFVDP